MNLWENLPKPFFMLAPMEAVTDIIFRRVIIKATRPDLFFTEFTNTSSFASEKGRSNAKTRLAFSPDEMPIVAQIWGSNPEHFAITANGLKDMGYHAIDINMGCPDKNVVKTGGGSDLIRNPKLATKIINATKTAGLQVSVKTRLGYSKVDEWRDWLSFLLEQDLSALTIHLRTKKEMSKVPAHLELISSIVDLRNSIAPNTLININGDIENKTRGIELSNRYNIDGIMIGRGVFRNPFCFEYPESEHSKEELLSLLMFHLEKFDDYVRTTEDRRFEPLKRFFKIYVNGFPGASEFREQLMNTESTEEARQVIHHHSSQATSIQ